VKYHVLVEGRHVEVDVSREGAGLRLVADGRSVHVDVGTLEDGRAYSLLLDGRSVDVAVEEQPGDRLDLLVSGRRYSTVVLGEREWLARSIQPDTDQGERVVRAVMTGIVREVLVAEGETVTAGQTLFILEAMKMENEVRAGVAGTVLKLSAAAGQTVTRGDAVVEIG